MEYLLHIAIVVLIYGMLALSLNISSGFTQLISLAQAGFFGVGAYTTAILSSQYAFPFWINMPIAMIVALFLAVVVGSLVLRSVDEYFVISTLALGAILFSVMNNWMSVTRGPLGIFGIPPASFMKYRLTQNYQWLLLSSLIYALLFV